MFGKRASFRWYARQDLNLRPSESESDALSAAPRARMFDLRRLARVCFLLSGGQTVVKGVSLFCFRCALCHCLQPLADFRYSTRRVCRSLTLYPAELRAHILFLSRCIITNYAPKVNSCFQFSFSML